ncbi:P-loop containing nucleoside triphosphate hydrolase protein [Piptocephalis cylindrospora]|uniref:P-loop containing nucleoside triphosphate hydrolase protein n=1 Tax=Piptocephalis cylindrospora TaxID=1907219 RepID=A0A4P9Y0V9_9FUNG|nr:P-loop containing nucleoside triphosphate hydrolase protein [Piptocephalis cylindrospora]|eukprot:RKP11691.1 P-loop containing nucleoside triphosphate hydrolase protein [Piptocephalis cylindrospora]
MGRVHLNRITFRFPFDPANDPEPDEKKRRTRQRKSQDENDNPLVLSRLELRIPAGRSIALVGGPGTGKTAFASLMLRLYNVQAGLVTVEGEDVGTRWRSESLRGGMGWVEGDAHFLGRTIREILTWGLERGNDQSISEALQVAGLEGWVQSLTSGLDTPVEGLTAMQWTVERRQRLAVARALVRQPKVLLLDDTTKRLSLEGEADLLESLGRYQREKDMTMVVMAHRISAARRADRIFVLYGGRVVEEGRHFDLLARRGRYHGMATRQSAALGEDAWDYVWEMGKRYVRVSGPTETRMKARRG